MAKWLTVDEFLASNNREADYYERLNCTEHATQGQIVAEYRALAKIYHPDKPSGNIEKFKYITTAYQVLTDPVERKHYDHYVASNLNISFERWKELKVHKRVMHWAVPKRKVVLEYGGTVHKKDGVVVSPSHETTDPKDTPHSDKKEKVEEKSSQSELNDDVL